MAEEPGNSGTRRRQSQEAAGQDGGKARKQQGETAEEPGNSGVRRQQSWEIAGQDGGRAGKQRGRTAAKQEDSRAGKPPDSAVRYT